MDLIKDLCRCETESCPSSKQCARYVNRKSGNNRAYFMYDREEGKCQFFIKQKGDQCKNTSA